MNPPPLCKHCGGGLPQHLEGPCWCKACMEVPASERCREYVRRPPKAEESKEGFGKKPPKPPKKAPKSMTASENGAEEIDLGPTPPATGTAQREAFDVFRGAGERGATDAEVAVKIDREHRDVTALRTALVRDGLLWDSGLRRRDPKGHENVAWTALPVDSVPEEGGETPLLVRDDVYVEQSGRTATLHAGNTSIRLTGVPGDLIEVRTIPSGADPDQEGGAEATLFITVEGSEEVYDAVRNPFTSPPDIIDAMTDLLAPALDTLAATRKDL